jgi:ribosomal protein S18 acetylase RimI-like enzyme
MAIEADMVVRPARAEEAANLGPLALRAKAQWGYDAAFLAAYRDALAVSAGDIAAHTVRVAEIAGEVCGFYQLRMAGETAELTDLWVEPGVIGRGVGRALWAHAVAGARERGCREVVVQSDPHAEGFYQAMGAERIGMRASAVIPGLELPLLRLGLSPAS